MQTASSASAIRSNWSWASQVSLFGFPRASDFTPLSVVCLSWPRFACTLQPSASEPAGRVMWFSMACTKRHPLGKSPRAPRVEAFFRATAVSVVSTGSSIPTCITYAAFPIAYFTANTRTGDAPVGSVVAVNWETKEVRTVTTGLSGVFGIARLGADLVVSESASHRIWRVTKEGTKQLLAGSGIGGTDDGVASDCELQVPLGVAVSGKTVFFVQSDGRLDLIVP